MAMQDGHRGRMKARFLQEGLDHFDERYVLEMLLFYCIPRKDTKPLACLLLEHFGSLKSVLEASAEELEKVEGVGEGVSTFITFLGATERYYQNQCAQHRAKESDYIMNSTKDYGAYLKPMFFNRRRERVYLMCLDAKAKAIACKFIGEGSVNSANIPIRNIVQVALASNATSVVLAHNHPAGFAWPSEEDIEATLRVAEAMAAVDITLIDHLIFADDDFVSMAQSRNSKRIFESGMHHGQLF